MATDDFNRADGGLGANWQNVGGNSISISSNTAVAPGFGNAMAGHTEARADDQGARVQCVGTDRGKGPACRVATGAYSGYGLPSGLGGATTRLQIWRVDSGSWTLLAEGALGTYPGTSDYVEIQAEGDEIRGYTAPSDGPPTTDAADVTVTDATHSSGRAGMILYLSGGTLDNFESFDLDSGITGTLAPTLPAFTTALAGEVDISGDFAITLPGFSTGFTGTVPISGALAALLPGLTTALAGGATLDGDLGALIPGLLAALDGEVAIAGDLAAVLPGLMTVLRDATVGSPGYALYRRLLQLLDEEEG